MNLTDEEQEVSKAFLRVKRAAKDPEAVRDKDRALVSVYKAHGAAEALRQLLERVGRFYRTTDNELLFHRAADSRLYEMDESVFQRYLIRLTNSPTGVKSQWGPCLLAWAQFDGTEVATEFLAYNSDDLDLIAINTFDGKMMMRRRGNVGRMLRMELRASYSRRLLSFSLRGMPLTRIRPTAKPWSGCVTLATFPRES